MPSVRPPTSTGASAGMRRVHRGRVLLLQQQQLVALRIGCICWWIRSMREAATALLLGMLRVSTRVGCNSTTLCSIKGGMDGLVDADQGSRTMSDVACIDTGCGMGATDCRESSMLYMHSTVV